MSATSPDNPLVEALRRKTNHQAERIDDLEKVIEKQRQMIDRLESRVEILEMEHSEVDE